MSLPTHPDEEVKPRKRLFIGLLTLASILVLALAFLSWWGFSVGLVNIHPALPVLFGFVLAAVSLLVAGGLFLLILNLLSERDLFLTELFRRWVIKYLFPAIITMARLFHIDQDNLRLSFVALNNQLVRTKNLRFAPEKILVLLPLCIQNYDCPTKITSDARQCMRCGRCDIKELVELAKGRGVRLAVASGGTLARKIIVDFRPSFIVAVACERDLTSGIRDAYPLPVIGILNRRPLGPCFNTVVDLPKIEKVLDAHLMS